ncbi:MAG TPA: hypothetical protein VLT57_13110, partial [Bryobacteraceae bacterium]|nr:hypothetical protein [Bryobacteraceae bacterium]
VCLIWAGRDALAGRRMAVDWWKFDGHRAVWVAAGFSWPPKSEHAHVPGMGSDGKSLPQAIAPGWAPRNVKGAGSRAFA